MNELPGSLGTTASLALRLGQAIFSVSSLLFMCYNVQFNNLPPFCFLVTIMGLVLPWSMTFALVDLYSICIIKLNSRQAGLMFVIVIGDWILSMLTLAAAGSVASLTDFLIMSNSRFCHGEFNLCGRYKLSVAMTFLSWSLSLASCLLNLWFIASM
ncbi:CASP-like protein 5C1 [Impatiens glandulifera]|uniref:CASP-like protein 5C1 n=1 Tax=Impatiens glandulifera TaxID=253017 RepID=UPI001FB05AF5|nr:CASP-like protein 5C1 [Impatiens glandulifera]